MPEIITYFAGKNVSFAGGSFKFTNNPTIIQSSFETDEEMGLKIFVKIYFNKN